METIKQPEIIDLTGLPQTLDILDPTIDASDPISESNFKHSLSLATRKKIRRKKKSRNGTDSQGGTAATTREPSIERNPSSGSSSVADHINTDVNNARTTKTTRHANNSRPTGFSGQAADASQSFFIDISPETLPSAPSSVALPQYEEEAQNSRLMLPAHVSVFGDGPVEIIRAPTHEPDEEDYIEYLDYEDRKVRQLH
ncbi:hypothetical protein AX17_000887 [Amanita inopinata Kibby_2008]|nr:hypothetical protein AX17_000887 [Amanita inopinata Kibby_2008]